MRFLVVILAAVTTCAAAGPALAACTVSSDAGAVARPINMTVHADADIMLSMSLLPKLMHIDYSSAAANTPSCDLGPLPVGSAAYELYGDVQAGGQRKAIPTKRGDPIAEIVPVINIVEALKAGQQGKPAAVKGYLLATVTPSDFTGWRYYTGMPDLATLKHDMAEALGGEATPIFRNGADGKIALYGGSLGR